ncbi:MAG: hypothetical protein GXO55_07625 [Chloroflexi bacterium]|nr:hypothetical protein [Chloroflexota bacterium]
MYPDSEILFPYRAVKGLKHLRGPLWQRLVERVLQLPEDHPDAIAFSFLIVRLADCLHCDQGSYKAYLGCQVCSQRIIAGFKGSDEDLLYLYEQAREDVRRYLEEGIRPPPEHLVPVKVRPVDAVDLEESTTPRPTPSSEDGWEVLDELLDALEELDEGAEFDEQLLDD